MANSFQKLADILNIENARLSGDPRRLQVASQMQEQKELKQATAQSEAEINKAIDESNLPESQKRLLKALSLREKAALFLETQKPKEEKYAKGADDLLRYTTGPRAGEQVFPGMTKPIKEMTPAEQIKAQEADVLKTLKTVQEEIEAGTRKLEPDQTIIDFLDDYEKIILKNYIERAQQEDSLSAIINAFQAGSGQSPLQITKVE
jgi:hypothetical protein